MATDGSSLDVPISYVADQSGIRLLELPPDLCDLITSNRLPQLSLKSAASSSDRPSSKRVNQSSAPSSAPQHVVLCTPTQTYQLRQVQTSNTVLVLRPGTVKSYDEEASATQESLCAFATCNSSLELNLLDTITTPNSKIKSAEHWVRDLLPFSESLQDKGLDVDMDTSVEGLSAALKDDIFADIPFSHGECEAAWRAIGAYEENGKFVKPLVKSLVQLWTSVFQSIDITKQFIPAALHDAVEEASMPLPLFKTVLKHLSTPSLLPDVDVDLAAPIQLDKEKVITWVGEIHYGNKVWHLQGSSRDPSSMTLDGWRDLLPESWSEDVTLQKFADLKYDRFKPSTAKAENLSPTGAAKRGPGRIRDWHQKFKRTKTK